jgi:hypothetical protein
MRRGQQVQDDAAHRRDPDVAGQEHDSAIVILGQEEIAERSLDLHLGARLERPQRLAAAARADADAELHRLRPLRRRGDGIRARHPLGEPEVHPLSGLERKVGAERDRELDDARRERLDLRDDGRVTHCRGL